MTVMRKQPEFRKTRVGKRSQNAGKQAGGTI